jgi:hypothetical protein
MKTHRYPWHRILKSDHFYSFCLQLFVDWLQNIIFAL